MKIRQILKFQTDFVKNHSNVFLGEGEDEGGEGGANSDEENEPHESGMEVYLNWIVEAWKALPEDLIAKSCGITNSIDGSEDNALHCFNIHGRYRPDLTP